jgi:hypothetical protein
MNNTMQTANNPMNDWEPKVKKFSGSMPAVLVVVTSSISSVDDDGGSEVGVVVQ